jgi:hypothetical protein
MDQCDDVKRDQGETGKGVRQGCCLSLILFKLYSNYLTKDTLESFGSFKIGQLFHTVKYADDLMLLVEEERCYRSFSIE